MVLFHAPRALLSLSLSLLFSSGCVIKQTGGGSTSSETPSGTASPQEMPSGASYNEVQRQLEMLHRYASESDVDQRDRLNAALELLPLLRRADAKLKQEGLVYLEQLARIESRSLPDTAPLLVGVGLVDEEEILRVDEVSVEELESEIAETLRQEEAREAEAQALDPEEVDVMTTNARQALEQQAYARAIQELKPLQKTPYWEDLGELWQRAVDGLVYQGRKAAGEAFVEARNIAYGPERTEAIEAVLIQLLRLRNNYPESSHREALDRNIRQVEKALERSREEAE